MTHHSSKTAFGFRLDTSQLRYVRLFFPYWKEFLLGLLYLLLTNLVAAVLPRLMNLGVNLIESHQLTAPFASFSLSVSHIIVLLICLAALGALLRVQSRRALFDVGRKIERDVRERLFRHLSLLSADFYRRKSVGELMSFMLSDVNNVRVFAGFATLNIFNILMISTINIPILVSINPTLAALSLAPFLGVTVLALIASRAMFRGTLSTQRAIAELSAHVQENLQGAQVVRMFHQEKLESIRFEEVNESVYAQSMRLSVIRTILFPLTRSMAGLSVAVALFVGGRYMVQGQISLGDFVEVSTRLLLLAWPAIAIGFIISVYSQGTASLKRINELLAETPTLTDGPKTSGLSGAATVDQLEVQFGDKRVLGPLSFSLRSGELLGVVGKIGSGKSVLAAVLNAMEPFEGSVFMDEVPLRQLNLSNVHAQVALVGAEAFLFSETLKDNICFAQPSASEDEVREVVRLVGLEPDVAQMPNGLNTLIGERGVMLSGGQRQRVALARALLAHPKLLILDDCFSAIDAETEEHIISHLLNKTYANSIVLISHRLNAMVKADRIIVLEAGHIKHMGTHAQLLQESPTYQALWGVQSLSESLAEAV